MYNMHCNMMPAPMPVHGHCCGSAPVAGHMESLEDMYPEVYRIVYPKIVNICNIMDVPGNAGLYPYPRREAVERMVDEIYNQAVAEMGDPEQYRDFDDYDSNRQFFGGGFVPGFGFGRRRIFRDLISILLIRQLLRRRPFFPGSFGFF